MQLGERICELLNDWKGKSFYKILKISLVTSEVNLVRVKLFHRLPLEETRRTTMLEVFMVSLSCELIVKLLIDP